MRLEFKPQAFEDLQFWVQTNPKLARRLLRLIEETRRDPFGGTGKPEPLKCRGRNKTGQRRFKTGLGDGTKPDFCVSPLQLTGDQRFEGEHPALPAGYGSAGE